MAVEGAARNNIAKGLQAIGERNLWKTRREGPISRAPPSAGFA